VRVGTENLAWHAEAALERHGDYEWIFFDDRWHTNGEIASRAARVATGLARLGLKPGDRLAVLMANCPEVFVVYQAAWRAGAAITPLIFLLTEPEIRYALADSGAVGIVTSQEHLAKVRAAADSLPSAPFVLTAEDIGSLEGSEPAPIADRDGSDLAALLYTGGTTGRSKGVPLTHTNMAWCGRAVRTAVAGDLTRQLLPLPLSHVFGLGVLTAGMFRDIPGRLLLMKRFEPIAWLELAQREHVEVGSLVPSMLQMLLASPLDDYDLSSLVAVTCGGAPLTAALRETFETRLPGTLIYEGYGCTEAGATISVNPHGRRRPGSVGLPVPGCEVSIRADDGSELSPGEDGEICARSPGVTAGYWHAASDESAIDDDGWLHTGDIGHLDADGYLYIIDRKKDLIIRGGYNVYPVDVENTLLRHPAVTAAGVVGRPDERLGEEIVAFVSVRSEVTPEELVAHARGSLAANKYPREIRIVPSLPLTSIGKLDRKRLRQWITTPDQP
jgi:long-chain acyl-CoA synthetase